MATLFQCPDCRAIHDGPAEARYVIAVRCEPCMLAHEFDAWQAEREAPAAPEQLVSAA